MLPVILVLSHPPSSCSERARVPARGHCKRREIRGIFKFAEVVPWCDWESQEG